jgi:hypothetical protein
LQRSENLKINGVLQEQTFDHPLGDNQYFDVTSQPYSTEDDNPVARGMQGLSIGLSNA